MRIPIHSGADEGICRQKKLVPHLKRSDRWGTQVTDSTANCRAPGTAGKWVRFGYFRFFSVSPLCKWVRFAHFCIHLTGSVVITWP